jgi:Ser-Thr-rich glycosyl-phosphatidyl-inositol-anchored membrane family
MKFLAVAAGLVAAASAYTYPTPFNPTASGAGPSGNAIYTPDTTSPATLGEAYEITWDPTTPGPVALVLCQGPSTDCEPILTIADSISNSGEFTWTPTDLTPSSSSSGGYGIMLIDYTTEAYQYSTQFGLLAGSSSVSSSSSAPASTKTTTSTVNIIPSSSSSSSVVVTPTPSAVLSTVISKVVSTTTVCPCETETEAASTTTAVPIPLSTGTISIPWTTSTGSPTVPTSVASTAPTQPAYTGAASSNMVSYGAIGAAAGLAALLAF